MREALAALEADGRTPVVSEIDLFLRLCPATTIGVTGTKGKTTTSSLIAAVLARGAAPSILGGNIGIPLVERLPELTPEHRVVVELSELQLPSLSHGTDVAVYTHVTSDHLDRHGTVEAYRAAKRRLAELLPSSGAIVVNAEDPVSSSFVTASAAPAMYYQRDEPISGGVGVSGDWIVADGVERLSSVGGSAFGGRIMPLGEVQIPGDHNTSNVLAAVAVGLLFGIAPDAIRAAIAQFRGVEHRLERVATIDRVTFVNDSQGTQPDAVIAALRAFDAPIVLIAGGRTKNVPLNELADVVAERAAAAILIGETADEMTAMFGRAGLEHIERATTLDNAVVRAFDIARDLAGDGVATVLLSPAATSFDMFVDYEHRGRAFKDAVADLATRGGGD